MSHSGVFYCSDALCGSCFRQRIVQSWVTVSCDYSLEWTVSQRQALPNMNDFLCCGPGLWHLSALHPSLLHHSLHISPTCLFTVHKAWVERGLVDCKETVGEMRRDSPSLCPLAYFPSPPPIGAWITQCFTRFAGKSSLSQGLWSALPPSSSSSPFLWLSLGTATHAPIPVDPSDPLVAPPWA